MDIILKNVTGEPCNDGLLWELSRVGFHTGDIIRGVEYSPTNKSCSWSGGTDHCVAWLGATCEEVPPVNKESEPARYIVIDRKLCMVPEKAFRELKQVKQHYFPSDMEAFNAAIKEKLELIVENHSVQLEIEQIYDTNDFW